MTYDLNTVQVGLYIPIISEVGDVLSGVFTALPGHEWISDAVSNGADFLVGIAKTWEGQVLLTGISNTMLFPTIANLAIPSASGMQFIGPQVASVVWALPGMAKGDSFVDSYAKEVTWRTVEITQVFGLGEEGKAIAKRFLDGIAKVLDVNNQGPAASQTALGDFNTIYGNLSEEEIRNKLHEHALDYEAIARKEYVRYDSAAAAINARLKQNIYDLQSFPVDGSIPMIVPIGKGYRGLGRGSVGVPLVPRPPAGERGGLTAVQKPKSATSSGLFGELVIFALLTSPVWAPFAWPRVKRALPRLKRTLQHVTSRRHRTGR